VIQLLAFKKYGICFFESLRNYNIEGMVGGGGDLYEDFPLCPFKGNKI